jgi:hypothetical protein
MCILYPCLTPQITLIRFHTLYHYSLLSILSRQSISSTSTMYVYQSFSLTFKIARHTKDDKKPFPRPMIQSNTGYDIQDDQLLFL